MLHLHEVQVLGFQNYFQIICQPGTNNLDLIKNNNARIFHNKNKMCPLLLI